MQALACIVAIKGSRSFQGYVPKLEFGNEPMSKKAKAAKGKSTKSKGL